MSGNNIGPLYGLADLQGCHKCPSECPRGYCGGELITRSIWIGRAATDAVGALQDQEGLLGGKTRPTDLAGKNGPS